MSEPFIGQIKLFAGNFAPSGWAFCDGQLLPIESYDALFSLIGTYYGGDGRSTFALPDLRGRAPLHTGTGPGLSPRTLGSGAGAETVGLTVANLPSHRHPLQASTRDAAKENPLDKTVASGGAIPLYGDASNMVAMAPLSTATGGSLAHNNIQPSLCVNFIIALVGLYPSRA